MTLYRWLNTLGRTALLLLLCTSLAAVAKDSDLPLIDAGQPGGGWTFNNGQEFPGATGGVELLPTAGHAGKAALKLTADLSKGGNYVEAGRAVANLTAHQLTFWVKAPGAEILTMRLIDESNTCHQIKLKLKTSDEWQQVQFPLADFFAHPDGGSAGMQVAKYEHWGKAKDQAWQGALTSIHILGGKRGESTAIWLSDIIVVGENPKGMPLVTQELALDEVLQAGEIDWGSSNGQEFPGAKVALVLEKDVPAAGQNALKLTGDFTGGGAYCEATKKFSGLTGKRLEAIVLSVRTTTCKSFNVRLGDATGQCHQAKGIPLTPDGEWHDVVIRPGAVAGGEHWAGANDGKWHDPAAYLAILIGKPAVDKPAKAAEKGVEPTGDAKLGEKPAKPAGAEVNELAPPAAPKAEEKPKVITEIEFTHIRALIAVAANLAPPAYRADFEPADSLKEWQKTGDVTRVTEGAFAGTGALRVARAEAQVNEPMSALGPSFTAQAGNWEITGAAQCAVYSPDVSYMGVVAVDWLDATGKVLAGVQVYQANGTHAWQPFKQQVAAPVGTVAGRMRVEFAKTYGTMTVDELSASYLQVDATAEPRIEKVVVMPAALGGLFLPDQVPTYKVTVAAAKPLKPEELAVTASVTDYWGAEQGEVQPVSMQKTGYKDQAFLYEGELKLAAPLRTGKFYYLHVEVPQPGQGAFRYTIGVAKVPEAVTKQLPPESVPFTIRNWDSRIKDYFFLADRLGFRLVGVWGGWDKNAPYKPHAPSIEFAQQCGQKWVTGTPAAQVELGKDYGDAAALGQGMTNFLKAYADKGMAYIAMGNEPHGGPEQIAKNVAAYKAIYAAAKAFDPNIKVIATSVEPNDEYFKLGYQDACDIYDFHVYESYTNVREALHAYQAMMKKYHAEKPIFSTELGLNCQGMARLAVASEMIKKFAVFFSAGGACASWFTIMYPDGAGKAGNSNGSAFNLYDCRYNAFNPKLDAITIYQALNAFADKKFTAEQHYANGAEAYLFTTPAGACLQVLWNEKARSDVAVPLAGVDAVRVIALDGSEVTLQPAAGAVTVTASTEPLLLLYQQAAPALAAALAPAGLQLAGPVLPVVKGATRDIALTGPGLTAAAVRVALPPGWQAACRETGADAVTCTITAPAATMAQLGRVQFTRVSGTQVAGAIGVELPVQNSYGGELQPVPSNAGGPGVAVRLVNHNSTPAVLHWQVTLDAERPIAKGNYNLSAEEPPHAYFTEATEGTATVAPGGEERVVLPLKQVDALALYHVKLRVTDDRGHETTASRFVAGFVGVRHGTPKMDGDLSDPAWADATTGLVNEERQFFAFKDRKWGGPADLSATVRFLWDEQYLYLAAQVTDDAFVGPQSEGNLWNQDGLQLLVDPYRTAPAKNGYYDYCLGLGTKGPQMWCNSTASPDVPSGEAKGAIVCVKRAAEGGNADYEVAIPWARLAPFKPAPGGDLGLSLILNDDDGKGRDWMGWFSGVHSKEVDMVADLVLQGDIKAAPAAAAK